MTRLENQTGYLNSAFVSIEGEGINIGVKALFLRLAGCSVGCAYCDTKASWDPHPKSWTLSLPDGDKQVENPASAGDVLGFISPLVKTQVRHIYLTGGEPLQQLDFTKSLAHLIHHKLQLPCILETSGLFPEELDMVVAEFQGVNLDIKLPSTMNGQENWDLYFRSLKVAVSSFVQVKVIVAGSTTTEEIEQAVELIYNTEPMIPMVLQPVDANEAFTSPTGEQLMQWQELGLRRLHDVRIIPQVHKVLDLP